jgi:hypothetical protein
LITASLDVVVQQGIVDERLMMDARKTVAISSVVAASMVGLARILMISVLKIDQL